MKTLTKDGAVKMLSNEDIIAKLLTEGWEIEGEENAEIRRVMIDRYGPARFVTARASCNGIEAGPKAIGLSSRVFSTA